MYCKFLAKYTTELDVKVHESAVDDNHKSVTVVFTVNFNKPKPVSGKSVPSNHIPAFPVEVGDVAQARLTCYDNNAGDWIYSVFTQSQIHAVDHARDLGANLVSESWTFNFVIPASLSWDSFRGSYQLFPEYDNMLGFAACAFYSSGSILVYNDTDGQNPEDCLPATQWEPDLDKLPPLVYDRVTLAPGDLFGMRYPGRVKSVKIAPPLHPIPYRHGHDFEGCHRNNVVQLTFNEPGIYAIRVNFVGGSDTRFFLVGASLPVKITPFARMCWTPTPNSTQDFSLVAKNVSGDFLRDFQSASPSAQVDTDAVVAKLDAYLGSEPVTMLLAANADNGSILVDDNPWSVDAFCQPSPSLDRFIQAAKGRVRDIYFFSPSIAQGLSATCHLLKYVVAALETANPYNPYGDPYRLPLPSAQAFGFDAPVAAVGPGSARPAYLAFSAQGQLLSAQASQGQGLASLAKSRKPSKSKPNFYIKKN